MKTVQRLLLVVVLTVSLSQLSFFIFNRGLKKYNNHSTGRLTELFSNKTYYEILFIGSSRTHTSINPGIIDSICKTSSYNAGVEGGNLVEFSMTFEAYLQNHPAPAIVVLTTDLISFDSKRKFFNYTQYIPFLDNRVISKTLSDNGYLTLAKKIVPFLWMTDFDDYSKGNAIKGILNKGGKQIGEGEFEYRGYLSNTNVTITEKDTSQVKVNATITPEALLCLQAIFNTCKKNDTHLILTYAPEFDNRLQKHYANSNEIFTVLDSFASKNNLPFLRHDHLDICKNPNLFANVGHLNTQGATVYSRILGKRLMEIKQSYQ